MQLNYSFYKQDVHHAKDIDGKMYHLKEYETKKMWHYRDQ